VNIDQLYRKKLCRVSLIGRKAADRIYYAHHFNLFEIRGGQPFENIS
jgi:hypothetical protein